MTAPKITKLSKHSRNYGENKIRSQNSLAHLGLSVGGSLSLVSLKRLSTVEIVSPHCSLGDVFRYVWCRFRFGYVFFVVFLLVGCSLSVSRLPLTTLYRRIPLGFSGNTCVDIYVASVHDSPDVGYQFPPHNNTVRDS